MWLKAKGHVLFMQQKVWTQVAPWLFLQLGNVFEDLAIFILLLCYLNVLDFILPIVTSWLQYGCQSSHISMQYPKGEGKERGKKTFPHSYDKNSL